MNFDSFAIYWYFVCVNKLSVSTFLEAIIMFQSILLIGICKVVIGESEI
jgi:hypothetical protein